MKELTNFSCPYCGCANYNSYEGIDREILALTGAVLIECPNCEAAYSIEQGLFNSNEFHKQRTVSRK